MFLKNHILKTDKVVPVKEKMFEKKEADDMKMIRSNNIFLTYSPEGKEAVEGEVKQEVTKEVIVPEVP